VDRPFARLVSRFTLIGTDATDGDGVRDCTLPMAGLRTWAYQPGALLARALVRCRRGVRARSGANAGRVTRELTVDVPPGYDEARNVSM
jgi:hypothetical protein